MNHEEAKQLLLTEPATRDAYAHLPQSLAVARKVVLRRRELGLSKEGLAEQLGATIDDVSEIESGHDLPSHSMLRRLATVLREPGLEAMAVGRRSRSTPVRYTSQLRERRDIRDTPHGRRVEISRGSRTGSITNRTDAKRDTTTGRFKSVKKDDTPPKGVRKKK